MAAQIKVSEIDPDTFYPDEEAARIRNKERKTQANERCERRGPAYTKIGNAVYYQGRDIIDDILRGRVDFHQPVAAPRRRVPRGR